MGREDYILNAAKILTLYPIKDVKILKIEPSGLSIYIAQTYGRDAFVILTFYFHLPYLLVTIFF